MPLAAASVCLMRERRYCQRRTEGDGGMASKCGRGSKGTQGSTFRPEKGFDEAVELEAKERT